MGDGTNMAHNDIYTFTDCPDRRDDEYMEGYGEYYCQVWMTDDIATWSCNYNCDNKKCPKGYAR